MKPKSDERKPIEVTNTEWPSQQQVLMIQNIIFSTDI